MLALFLAVSATQAAVPAGQEPDPTCAVSRATVFVRRFADLPQAVRDDVLRGGEIAEADQPFTEGDEVYLDRPRLPGRRFVLAGRSDGNWFVWIDHGGFARHYHVLGYQPVYSGNEARPTLTRFADFEGEPCEAINAFFHGVTTSTESEGQFRGR